MIEQISGVELQIDDARWPRPPKTVAPGRLALDLQARRVSADAIESRWSSKVLGPDVHLWMYVIEKFELDSQRWRRQGTTSIEVVGHIYYSREVLATVYFHGIVHDHWREEQSARSEVERLHEGVRGVTTTLRIGGHFPYPSSRLRVTLPCFVAEELWGVRRLGEIYFAALDLDGLCRGYADRDWVLYAQFVAGPLVGKRGLQLIEFLRAIVPTGSPDLYSLYQPLAFWTALEREAQRPTDHLAGVGQLLAETREERPGHLISTGEVEEYYQQVYPEADGLACYTEDRDWENFYDIDPWGDQEDGWGHHLHAEGQEGIPWGEEYMTSPDRALRDLKERIRRDAPLRWADQTNDEEPDVMGEPVVTEPQETLKTGTSSGRREATRRRSHEYERRETMADRHRDDWRESSSDSYWRDRDRDRAPPRRVFDPQTGESHPVPYESKDRYIIMHKASEPPTFRGYGITEYLEKWELHASRKLYKLEDNKYSIKDLETMTQDEDESVRAFGMLFQKISDVLMKKGKISEVERCTIFIGHLSKGRQKSILRDLPRDKLDFLEVLKLAIKAEADDYKDLVWRGMRRRDFSLYKEYATDRCPDFKDLPWSEKSEAVAEEVKEIRDMVKGLTRQVTEIVTSTGATTYRDKPGGPYSLRWDRRNTDSWRSVEDRNPRTLTDYRTRERERDDEPWRRKDDEIDQDRRARETYGRARRLDDYLRSPRYEADRGRGDSRGQWESDQGRRDGYRDCRYERSDRDGYRDERYERTDRDGYGGDRYERGGRDVDRRDDSRGRYDRGGYARERCNDSRGWYSRGDRRDETRGRYDAGDRRNDSRGRYESGGSGGDRRNDSRDRNERGGYGASSEPYPKSPDPRAARGTTSRGTDDRPPTPRNSCVYCRGDVHIKRDCPDLKRAIDEGLVVLDDRKYVKWADDLRDLSMFPSMKENVEARRVKPSRGKELVKSQSIKITFEGDMTTTPIRVAATKSARGSTSKETDTDYVMAEKDGGQRIDGEEVILSPRKRGVKKLLMKSSLDEIDTVEPLRRALRQPMQCSILEYLAASKPTRDEL
ncbi:hypothetical protein CBR_g16106 [Chara braunii]|uniref:CCHC-type domain-containing protein n=1 Tax=Chara braunii TaxID=69332 RepID=A0A388KTQ7_CHABU|nr:hypothetical protein CBR_g16106 [Chara braunii]|eukprot:GBG73392.1 hypothetical protein CBR_g16106 [Chara braunii]